MQSTAGTFDCVTSGLRGSHSRGPEQLRRSAPHPCRCRACDTSLGAPAPLVQMSTTRKRKAEGPAPPELDAHQEQALQCVVTQILLAGGGRLVEDFTQTELDSILTTAALPPGCQVVPGPGAVRQRLYVIHTACQLSVLLGYQPLPPPALRTLLRGYMLQQLRQGQQGVVEGQRNTLPQFYTCTVQQAQHARLALHQELLRALQQERQVQQAQEAVQQAEAEAHRAQGALLQAGRQEQQVQQAQGAVQQAEAEAHRALQALLQAQRALQQERQAQQEQRALWPAQRALQQRREQERQEQERQAQQEQEWREQEQKLEQKRQEQERRRQERQAQWELKRREWKRREQERQQEQKRREQERQEQQAQEAQQEPLAALHLHSTADPFLTQGLQKRRLCPHDEFDAAFAAGGAVARDMLLRHMQLSPLFTPLARTMLLFSVSQAGGVVYVAQFRRSTPGDRWPFASDVIAVLSGRGGAPVALPGEYSKVPDSERAVVIRDLYRPLLTGQLILPLLGPVRRLGAGAAELGEEAGGLGTHTRPKSDLFN